MNRPCLCRTLLRATGVVLLCATSAFSFIPYMDVKMAMYHGHYSQMGSNGFFGPYDVDNAAGHLAPANAWVGNGPDVQSLSSGSNVAISSLVFVAHPTVDLLKARIGGTYKMNVYNIGSAPGASVPISNGQWTQYDLLVPTPVVQIRYGKTLFHHGNRYQFGYDRTSDHLLLEAHIGVHKFYRKDKDKVVPVNIHDGMDEHLPSLEDWFEAKTEGSPKEQKKNKTDIAIALGFYRFLDDDEQTQDGVPYGLVDGRLVEALLDETEDHFSEEAQLTRPWRLFGYTVTAGAYYTPQLTIGLGFHPWRSPQTDFYDNDFDLNAANTVDLLAYLNYSGTNMACGIGATYTMYRAGPESQPTVAARSNFAPFDVRITEGWIYLKYNNGKFLLNSEVDWYHFIQRYQRSLTGRFGNGNRPGLVNGIYADGSGRSPFAPIYTEAWRYMVEAGCMLGPFVVRGMYTYIPGPDRRHGILIDRQPFVLLENQASTSVFLPYNMLMGNLFRAGVNSFGGLPDASAFSVRLDYAVAANLIAFGTYMKAYRTSHGYGWGFIRPDPANFGQVDLTRRGGFLNPAPAIPEDDLGWEATGGVRWQLLENWEVGFRIAYWQPGRWFKYACVDRSVPNWSTPTAANNWGINPDRRIDPYIGIEVALGAGF